MPRPLPWPVTETDASLSARLSGAVVWSSRLTRWQQSPCDEAEAARTYYLLNHSATARRTEIRTRNEDVRVIRRVTARYSVLLLVLSTSIIEYPRDPIGRSRPAIGRGARGRLGSRGARALGGAGGARCPTSTTSRVQKKRDPQQPVHSRCRGCGNWR